MTKVIICFSSKGKRIIKELNDRMTDAGIEPAEGFICMNDPEGSSREDAEGKGDSSLVCNEDHGPCIQKEGLLKSSLDEFVRQAFERRCAIIFVGAVGIAVRAVSPYVKDKLSDSPVIVIDDNGTFVIPILSGHAGGANKLAVMIARILDAVPVITTSTDAGGAFSADVFACENNLTIRNRDGIKKVSAKAIEGKAITLSVKNYPPDVPVDIIITDDTDREYSLLLSPKRYVIGLGMRKGKDPAEAEEFILSVLNDNDIDLCDVYAVASIDIKAGECALKAFSEKYRIPVIVFDAPLLEKAEGDFSSSEFVRQTVGVDNVCERAAALAAGPSGRLIVNKTKGDGITAAVALRQSAV